MNITWILSCNQDASLEKAHLGNLNSKRSLLAIWSLKSIGWSSLSSCSASNLPWLRGCCVPLLLAAAAAVEVPAAPTRCDGAEPPNDGICFALSTSERSASVLYLESCSRPPLPPPKFPASLSRLRISEKTENRVYVWIINTKTLLHEFMSPSPKSNYWDDHMRIYVTCQNFREKIQRKI